MWSYNYKLILAQFYIQLFFYIPNISVSAHSPARFMCFFLCIFPFCRSDLSLAGVSATLFFPFTYSFCHFTFRLLSAHKAIFITFYARKQNEQKFRTNRFIDETEKIIKTEPESVASYVIWLCRLGLCWFQSFNSQYICLVCVDGMDTFEFDGEKMPWKLKRYSSTKQSYQLQKLSMKQTSEWNLHGKFIDDTVNGSY